MAGVSQGSMFFSQFSIVGLGISPGSNSPAVGTVSVKVSQSPSTKRIHRTNPHLNPGNQPTANKLTCLEKRQARLAGRPQPHPRAATVAPSARHLVAAVRLLRVRLWLRAGGLDVRRLHEEVGRVPLCAPTSSAPGRCPTWKQSSSWRGMVCGIAYIAPAHLRQSMQSDDERGGSASPATVNGFCHSRQRFMSSGLGIV